MAVEQMGGSAGASDRVWRVVSDWGRIPSRVYTAGLAGGGRQTTDGMTGSDRRGGCRVA